MDTYLYELLSVEELNELCIDYDINYQFDSKFNAQDEKHKAAVLEIEAKQKYDHDFVVKEFNLKF